MTFTLQAKVRFASAALLLCAALGLVGIALVSSRAAAPLTRQQADVTKVIVPFVQKHCVGCHGDKKPRGDLSLHAFKDEVSILKARKTWASVLDQLNAGEMPPKERPKPSFDEAERFTKAVRAVFERHDRNAPRDPGVVTIRRLNRAEYVNTVRDLVGVNIPLGDDFPADQTGHGFDNVGDVLTLSPLQLERYLATAETVMKAAIVVGKAPTPPTQRASGNQKFEGTSYGPRYDDRGRIQRDARGKPIPEKERRPVIAGDGWRAFYSKGPFQKRLIDLETAGDYQVTARVQALPAGDEAPKFALLVNGKEVLRGTCGDRAEEHTASVRLKPGELRVGVSLLNEWTDSKDDTKRRGIILHSISVTGPTLLASQEMLLAGSEKLKGDARSRHVLERFASRAYRRPATKEEVDRLMKFVGQAEKIHWLGLSDESNARMQKAKVPQNVINNLKALAKADACDQDAFVKAVRGKLNEELFAKHLKAILDAADRATPPWEGCVSLAMRAVLCSPKFLYRAELDSRPGEKGPQPLDDYALASRLSYFLWSSMPDQELFDLAAKKQLHKELPAQVKRMLADPRSKALFDNFATQWLGLRRLHEFTPAPGVMPDFSKIRARGNWADLRGDMLTETGLFFTEIVRENHSIFDLIDARFTYVNQRLATLYDIGDTNGNSAQPKAKPINPLGNPIPSIELLEGGQDSGTVVRTHNPFVRVKLENTRRGGILTQASVLAVTSHPTRTSPVKRGAWVLERLLGTPPPPPPPDVPELGAKNEAKATTLRQQMEFHRKSPNCAGCHARIDPIGFAFENFDAIGKFRDMDGDRPIDASGELPSGKKFNGPDELKAILKGEKELFSRNLTEKLLVYAIGRGLDFYDRRTVNGILTELQQQDYRFQALLTAIVQSDAFRLRRGKDQK